MKSSPSIDVRSSDAQKIAPKSASKRWRLVALVAAGVGVGGGALWRQTSHVPQAAAKTANVQAISTQNVASANDASANVASANAAAPGVETANVATNEAKRLEYEVVGVHPHDARAFTQGLVWHDGGFYESTGLNGESTLRRVAFPSGRVLEKKSLPSQYFAEGLALANDKLVQITWTSGKAFVYDRASFKLLQTWNYSGEGWGLAFDGTHFVMSDGSDTLFFRDAQNFQLVRRVKVTLNGEPLTKLNELEIVNGEVWANVWQTDFIVQIEPRSGRVVSYLDLSGLHPRSGNDDVLNGIAFDKKRGRLFVTGKRWPKLYQIKVVSRK